MARHPKTVAGGVYQPVHSRRAYGRRKASQLVIEEEQQQGNIYADVARNAPVRLERKEVRMPRGGTRQLVCCPVCECWRARLYDTDSWAPACRVCKGFRYQSQYAGRRLEADARRLEALLESARTAKHPTTRLRRQRRYQEAAMTLCTRSKRFEQRQELARTIAELSGILRVNRWLARSTQTDRRDEDTSTTPQHRDQRETDRENATECAQNRAITASSHPLEANPDTLITEECLAQLRAAYAALGQARQRAKAA